jgi:hypothetical protein
MVATDKSQPTHRLHWLGGSYTGAAAGRHVNGYAAWSGTGYFDLPVGDGTKMQPCILQDFLNYLQFFFPVPPHFCTDMVRSLPAHL